MLRCTHHHALGVDLADIEGRFVQCEGGEIRHDLLHFVATGSGKLVLNLTGATCMDAYGLASLVLVWKAMQGRHGRVVLSAVPPHLEALIELTRLEALFEIFTCVTAAVADLSAVHQETVADSRARPQARSPTEASTENARQPATVRTANLKHEGIAPHPQPSDLRSWIRTKLAVLAPGTVAAA